MALSGSSGKTGREAEAYIFLGRLLGKKQEEDERRAVDQIVSSNLSVQEKFKPFTKASYIPYLFSNYRRILAFGKRPGYSIL